jgi:hypothetical protein
MRNTNIIATIGEIMIVLAEVGRGRLRMRTDPDREPHRRRALADIGRVRGLIDAIEADIKRGADDQDPG